MWADTVILRVGEQLVGLRPDTDAAAAELRAVFGEWLDDAASGPRNERVPWAFSVRLDTAPPGRGPRPVPQLRLGGVLLHRSRRAGDVVDALDRVLGGVLARQDDSRCWLGLRTFVAGDRAVLVDAAPPALTADPALSRSGVTELPVWVVAVDADGVQVPPPLTAAGDTSLPGDRFRLAGIVGLDPCSHTAHTAHTGGGDDQSDDQVDSLADHIADQHPSTPGAVLARFAARHTSIEWFQTVEELVDAGCVRVSTERTEASDHIRHLLAAGEAAS